MKKKPFSTNNVRCPLLFFPLAQQTDDFDRMTFFFSFLRAALANLKLRRNGKKQVAPVRHINTNWDFLMSIRAERSVLCAGLARLSPIWLYGVSRSPRCSSPAWVFSFFQRKINNQKIESCIVPHMLDSVLGTTMRNDGVFLM